VLLALAMAPLLGPSLQLWRPAPARLLMLPLLLQPHHEM